LSTRGLLFKPFDFNLTIKLSMWFHAKMLADRLQEFVRKRCSKCPQLAQIHAWKRFLHWVNCSVNNVLLEIEPKM